LVGVNIGVTSNKVGGVVSDRGKVIVTEALELVEILLAASFAQA